MAHEEQRKYGTAVRIEIGVAVGDLFPAESGRRAEKIGISAGFSCHTPEHPAGHGELALFFAERHLEQDVIYDGHLKGYRMVSRDPHRLTDSEVLAVCKILLESRSLPADDMLPTLDKLIDCAVPPENQWDVRALVANEKLHYTPPHHGQHILDTLWTLGQAVRDQRVIEVEYQRMKDPQLVKRRMQPVGIMFSEYYFYLTAFLEDKTDYTVAVASGVITGMIDVLVVVTVVAAVVGRQGIHRYGAQQAGQQ